MFREGMLFITTEKDFVKIKNTEFVNDYPVYFLKLKIELKDKTGKFKNKLDKLLK